MMTSINHHSRPCPRTQMSRHDRIARIIRRNIQRCTCELNGGASNNAPSRCCGASGCGKH